MRREDIINEVNRCLSLLIKGTISLEQLASSSEMCPSIMRNIASEIFKSTTESSIACCTMVEELTMLGFNTKELIESTIRQRVEAGSMREFSGEIVIFFVNGGNIDAYIAKHIKSKMESDSTYYLLYTDEVYAQAI